MRMPRPPPPAEALIISGKPIACASSRAVAASATRPSEPGTTGTPAFNAAPRADALSPIARIVSPLGPTKIRPAASTASAKAAFSERKP